MPAADGPSEWLAIRVLPPPAPSVFEDAQVVAFYGHPGIPGMGALGVYGPERLAEEVTRVAALYDALNGDRDVIPALHLITSIAQPRPGADGTYLEFISDEKLAIYVDLAEEHGLLLILDEQIGWSDPLTDVQRLEWALKKPFVHLALDPEWSTRPYAVAPGVMIGTLGAPEVNAVQQYLADLVRRYNLPPKVLVLHQFRSGMLTDTESYRDVLEVEISIDMDGFGGPWPKLANYDRFALAEYSERPAIKLFYDWDVPLMDPARIQGLDTPPDLIIYQ
ncbi:MAG TPA: hypothetical protein QGI71_05595 [Dehalococcoidia bacterium]|jgi:hypothetical protein|nr:hypothetical protein [Dehalococcoidia bacterium]